MHEKISNTCAQHTWEKSLRRLSWFNAFCYLRGNPEDTSAKALQADTPPTHFLLFFVLCTGPGTCWRCIIVSWVSGENPEGCLRCVKIMSLWSFKSNTVNLVLSATCYFPLFFTFQPTCLTFSHSKSHVVFRLGYWQRDPLSSSVESISSHLDLGAETGTLLHV